MLSELMQGNTEHHLLDENAPWFDGHRGQNRKDLKAALKYFLALVDRAQWTEKHGKAETKEEAASDEHTPGGRAGGAEQQEGPATQVAAAG